MNDSSIDDHYINPATKDYFRHFPERLQKQDET